MRSVVQMVPQRQDVAWASWAGRNKLASFVSMVLIQNNNNINKRSVHQKGEGTPLGMQKSEIPRGKSWEPATQEGETLALRVHHPTGCTTIIPMPLNMELWSILIGET